MFTAKYMSASPAQDMLMATFLEERVAGMDIAMQVLFRLRIALLAREIAGFADAMRQEIALSKLAR